MRLQPPVIAAYVRIAQCNLTDRELAFLADIVAGAGYSLPGWSSAQLSTLRWDFAEAAKLRGINKGCKVVTTTVDLRA